MLSECSYRQPTCQIGPDWRKSMISLNRQGRFTAKVPVDPARNRPISVAGQLGEKMAGIEIYDSQTTSLSRLSSSLLFRTILFWAETRLVCRWQIDRWVLGSLNVAGVFDKRGSSTIRASWGSIQQRFPTLRAIDHVERLVTGFGHGYLASMNWIFGF